MIFDIYGFGNPINQVFLRKKVIEKFGEKDISSRSLRNLFSTLVDFGILEKHDKDYIVGLLNLKLMNLMHATC